MQWNADVEEITQHDTCVDVRFTACSRRTTWSIHGAVVAKVPQDGLWRVTWSEDADAPESSLDERVAAQYAALMPAGAPIPRCWSISGRKGKRIETPSVVTGRYLSAGRNDTTPETAGVASA